MKKMVALILIMVPLFSMVACNSVNKDIMDEAAYRQEYALRLSKDPKELAEYLSTMSELDKFVDINVDDHSKTIDNAVAIFFDDESIHGKALEMAKEIFAETHIDCNWETLQVSPFMTNAEMGELISSEPAAFWLPPEEFLTEDEKKFRNQVIEAAELDKNSPDFEDQLARLYNANYSSEYPNYETYKLFVNHLKQK